MPTYDYRCKKCGHEFALFQGINDKPRKSCPGCKGRVERLITGGNFILKGDGFYSTDYRSQDYKKAAEKDKADASVKPAPGGKAGEGAKAEKKSSERAAG